LHQIEANLIPSILTLAKIDQDLYIRDQRHRELTKNPKTGKLAELAVLGDSIGLSYLWILGAFEAIRTIDQRFYELKEAAEIRKKASTALKHSYGRVRIPLAKLEASNRHKNTDYAFARPGIDDERGIAWEVAKDVVISRSQLSDEFLEFLEGLQRGTIKN
jgi:hypothetical protein